VNFGLKKEKKHVKKKLLQEKKKATVKNLRVLQYFIIYIYRYIYIYIYVYMYVCIYVFYSCKIIKVGADENLMNRWRPLLLISYGDEMRGFHFAACILSVSFFLFLLFPANVSL